MSDYIIRDGELYHYGVPGMKWGVRKTKAQRQKEYVKKYKQKELKKLEARSARMDKKYGRIVDMSRRNFDKKLAKYGQPPATANERNPTTKAANWYAKAKAIKTTEERVIREEAKKVASMSLSDIKAERVKVGRAYITTSLITAASIGTMLATPVPFGVVVAPNTRNIKRKNRVSTSRVDEIYRQAFAEAASDIYRK